MFLFQKGKLPKIMTKLGYNARDHKVESGIPSKRKRADSKSSNPKANDSLVSENSTSIQNSSMNNSIPLTRHKLRRTKKHENLRDEWKKYHNNFVPVIPSNSSNTVSNTSLKSSDIHESSNLSIELNEIKYSIKNSFDKGNYVQLDNASESKEHHISKKRRLFSFIPI